MDMNWPYKMASGVSLLYDRITDPPKTAKEPIYWILRVARKDNTYQESNHYSEAFCESVNGLLGKGKNGIDKTKFDALASVLQTFIGWKNGEIGEGGIAKNYLKEVGLQSDGNGSGAQSVQGPVTQASQPAATNSTSHYHDFQKALAALQELVQQLQSSDTLANEDNVLPESIIGILMSIEQKNTNSSSESDDNPLTKLMDVTKAIGSYYPLLDKVLEQLKTKNQATSLGGIAEDIKSCIEGLNDALETIKSLNAQEVSKTAQEWLDKVNIKVRDEKTLSEIAEHLNSDSTSEEMKKKLSNGELNKEVDDFTTWLDALVNLSGGGLAEMVEALKGLLEAIKSDTTKQTPEA